MPWSVGDVDRHKKGLSAKQKRKWVAVANSVLSKCMADGGKESECAASAIRQANGVTGNESSIELHSIQTDQFEVRTTMHQGRKHIIVPVVMMVEGVHNGSHGPLYHSAQELGRFPESWNGIPVTIDHPEVNGSNVSANQPEIIDSRTVGRVYNTHMDGGRLRAEAWIDEAKIGQLSPQALAHIRDGKPLEVSVGVFSDEEPAEGTWNNEDYVAIARNHRPDHLALLPGGVGACSWNDGCGVRANKKAADDEEDDAKKKDEEDDDEEEEMMDMSSANSSDNKEGGETTDLVKIFKELGAEGYSAVQVNVQTGYRELMGKIQSQLDTMDNDSKVHFLHEVYDGSVVYEVMGRDRSVPSAFYRQSYEVNDKGVVALTGNAIPVVRQISFVNANNEAQSNNEEGITTMAENATKKPCCPGKVELLIQSKHSPYQEVDREWLLSLEEAQINRMVEVDAALVTMAKKVEELPQLNKEQAVKELKEILSNPDQFITLLAPELQEQMRSGMQLHREKRQKLIQALVQANSKKFSEEKLKDRTMEALEELVSLIPEKSDYSVHAAGGGALGGTAYLHLNNNSEEDMLLPAGVEIKQ